MMINALTVNVTDQKPYVEVNNSMVEDSENIYSVTFIFDEMWDGFAKTAIFQNTANKMIVMAYLDEEGKCELHPSVLKKGRLEIGVRGVKGDQVITTSASSPAVNIKENAIELDLSSESPSPFSQTLYDDLVARIEKKEEEGGAGVTDYNDLENKPCWTEVGEMVEILPETDCVFENSDFLIPTQPTNNIAIGEKCTVNFNGVEYPSTVYDGAGMNFEGFIAIINDGTNITNGDGAVFVIIIHPEGECLDGQCGVVQVFSEIDALTISIYQENETVHKLDPKYLPDNRIIFFVDPIASTVDCNVPPNQLVAKLTSNPFMDIFYAINIDNKFVISKALDWNNMENPSVLEVRFIQVGSNDVFTVIRCDGETFEELMS